MSGVANTCFASYAYNCLYYADFEDVQHLIENTEEMADRIDDVANLATDRVYILHSLDDMVTDPDAAQLMSEYYAEYVDDHDSQVVLNRDIPCTQAPIQSDEWERTNSDINIEDCVYDG